jgi:hypothetical protein
MRRGLASKLRECGFIVMEALRALGLELSVVLECRGVQRANGFLPERLCGRARRRVPPPTRQAAGIVFSDKLWAVSIL